MRKKYILWSAVIALGFLILSYFVSNLPYSIMGEKQLLRKFETLKNSKWVMDPATALFINVNYDKEMRPECDSILGWCGRIPVTDRHKLLELLQYLKRQEEKEPNYYKYILLDVFFGADVKTEWDDELFSTILSMPRIVIPYRKNERIADERLMGKAYLAKYNQSINVAGFTKYPYYLKTGKRRWEKTLPAAMFEELEEGRKIKKFGPIYFEGRRLAKRSCFLALNQWPEPEWQNLGMEMLGDTLSVVQSKTDTLIVGKRYLYDCPDMTRNKYIIIGSYMGDDMHGSFKGNLSGAAINYYAFCAMKEDQYLIHSSFLWLFLVYFVITYIIIDDKKGKLLTSRWFNKLSKREKIIVFFSIMFISSFLGLKLVTIVLYVIYDRVYEIFIVSAIYSIMASIITLKKHIQS